LGGGESVCIQKGKNFVKNKYHFFPQLLLTFSQMVARGPLTKAMIFLGSTPGHPINPGFLHPFFLLFEPSMFSSSSARDRCRTPNTHTTTVVFPTI